MFLPLIFCSSFSLCSAARLAAICALSSCAYFSFSSCSGVGPLGCDEREEDEEKDEEEDDDDDDDEGRIGGETLRAE